MSQDPSPITEKLAYTGIFQLQTMLAAGDLTSTELVGNALSRIRAAGGIVIGTTNLSEWANIRSARSTGAWSAVGGSTGNPWALDRNAGGSSSGSGAAVAAGLRVGR